MPPKRRAAPRDSIDDVLVDAVVNAVQSARSLPIRKLTSEKLTKRAQLMLFEALERRGFERTPSAIRVALAQQLADVVERESHVPIRGLKKMLAGCGSDAEAKRVAVALAKHGRLHWVVTQQDEVLVAPGTRVLDGDGLTRLTAVSARLTKLAKRLKSPKGGPAKTVEVDVLSGLADELVGRAASNGADTAESLRKVQSVLHAARESVFVPTLARTQGLGLSPEQLKELLVQEARAGRMELRPESSIGLLSEEDRGLCPTTRDGTPLSYVRLTRE